MTKQNQRILILARHAQAVEDDPGGDHTRPLSPRGQKDAAALGHWLAQQGRVPEQVFCSTATRTRQTLGLISEAMKNVPPPVRGRLGGGRHLDAGQVFITAPPQPSPSGGGSISANLPTLLRDKMYLASAPQLLALIQGADDEVRTLMLVGHNPGMHSLLATLIADYTSEKDAERVVMKFPTAACAVLRVNADQWADVSAASATLELLRWSAEEV